MGVAYELAGVEFKQTKQHYLKNNLYIFYEVSN